MAQTIALAGRLGNLGWCQAVLGWGGLLLIPGVSRLVQTFCAFSCSVKLWVFFLPRGLLGLLGRAPLKLEEGRNGIRVVVDPFSSLFLSPPQGGPPHCLQTAQSYFMPQVLGVLHLSPSLSPCCLATLLDPHLLSLLIFGAEVSRVICVKCGQDTP